MNFDDDQKIKVERPDQARPICHPNVSNRQTPRDLFPARDKHRKMLMVMMMLGRVVVMLVVMMILVAMMKMV